MERIHKLTLRVEVIDTGIPLGKRLEEAQIALLDAVKAVCAKDEHLAIVSVSTFRAPCVLGEKQ